MLSPRKTFAARLKLRAPPFGFRELRTNAILDMREPSEYFRFSVPDSPMTRAKVFGKAAHHANDDEALYFDGCIRRARIRSL
jgi:hypothetical protein